MLTPRFLLNLTLFLSLILGTFAFSTFEKTRFENKINGEINNSIEFFQSKHMQSYLNFISDASVVGFMALSVDHTYVIKKKLQTLVQNQKISGIRLVNKNCDSFSEFGSYGEMDVCQKIPAISLAEPKKFYWNATGNTLELYFLTSFPDSEQPSFFISYEKIDLNSFLVASHWLEKQKEQGFNFGFLLDDDSQFTANTYATQSFSKHNHFFKKAELIFKNSELKTAFGIFILCIAIIFILGQLAYIRQVKLFNSKKISRKKFLDDIYNIIKEQQLVVEKKISSLDSHFNEEVLQICRLILAEISRKNIKTEKENEALLQLAKKLKEENSNLNKKTSENLSFDLNRPRVLAQADRIKKLQDALSIFIQNNKTTQEDFQQYLTNIKSIFSFIHTGIENRKNAKGFFRALAETPANNLNHSNLLEEVLESLYRNFMGIDNSFSTAKIVNKETKYFADELNKLAQQFRHFIESTNPINSAKEATTEEVKSLAHSILDLQAELCADGLIHFEFKNKFDPEDSNLVIKFNHSVLKAIYAYFCYFFDREHSRTEGKSSLETTLKVSSGIGRVVLMYTWEKGAKIPRLKSISQNFLDSCKQQGIALSFLPNKNSMAVVLRLEELDKQAVPKQEIQITASKDTPVFNSNLSGLN
ncbi:MAG: hypothetical protein KBD78_12530 [Oligoflexales bacterium]|nr:hypothetical protein [Oligoflexales bacterium]